MGNTNKVATLIRYTKKIYTSDVDKSLSRIREEAKVINKLWTTEGLKLKIWDGSKFVSKDFNINDLTTVRAAYFYQDTNTLVLEIF